MPVREKVESRLRRMFMGGVWYLHGEPQNMSAADHDAVVEFCQDVYAQVIEGIDWERILLEASGRCEAHGHFDDEGSHSRKEGPCADSIEAALLVYDRPWYGDKGGWDEADQAILHRKHDPKRWSLPDELRTMMAAWIRARRKSQESHES
jgi:hypothetical protein